jgi:O-antigen ligase
MKTIINKQTWLILGIILLIESLSLGANSFVWLNQIMFAIIMIGALILCFKDLKYGILLALFELFIGSMGYLFSWTLGDTNISIRIGIWLIVMAVWLYQEAWHLINQQKFAFKLKTTKYWKHYLILFLAIAFAGFNGLVRQHGFDNVFLDGNNWLYLFLILPAWRSLDKAGLQIALKLLMAASIWLSVKTIFILFVSTHKIIWQGQYWFAVLYKWIRDTRIGEITNTEFGFYRIFFQSHLFIIFALLLVLFLFAQAKKTWQNLLIHAGLTGLFLATLIISMSRSLWLGLAAGLCLWLIVLFSRKDRVKQALVGISLVILSGIIAMGLILAITKFPIPQPLGADALSALTARTQGGDAALSSRWNLLPPLWTAIKQAPLVGQGFGATVTYHTNDPRVLEQSADGQYTTYAFEWGWLDTWLEMGLLGLAIYLFLLISLIYEAIRLKSYKDGVAIPVIIIGLVSLMVVNAFTPYLNHPLGLGWLILATIILERQSRISK